MPRPGGKTIALWKAEEHKNIALLLIVSTQYQSCFYWGNRCQTFLMQSHGRSIWWKDIHRHHLFLWLGAWLGLCVPLTASAQKCTVWLLGASVQSVCNDYMPNYGLILALPAGPMFPNQPPTYHPDHLSYCEVMLSDLFSKGKSICKVLQKVLNWTWFI